MAVPLVIAVVTDFLLSYCDLIEAADVAAICVIVCVATDRP